MRKDFFCVMIQNVLLVSLQVKSPNEIRCYHCKQPCSIKESKSLLFSSDEEASHDDYCAPSFIMEYDLDMEVPLPSQDKKLRHIYVCAKQCYPLLRKIHKRSCVKSIVKLQKEFITSLSVKSYIGKLFYMSTTPPRPKKAALYLGMDGADGDEATADCNQGLADDDQGLADGDQGLADVTMSQVRYSRGTGGWGVVKYNTVNMHDHGNGELGFFFFFLIFIERGIR